MGDIQKSYIEAIDYYIHNVRIGNQERIDQLQFLIIHLEKFLLREPVLISSQYDEIIKPNLGKN